MTPEKIVLIVLCVLLAVFLVALVILGLKLRNIRKPAEQKEERADQVKIVKGVRYSKEDAILDAEGMNVTHLPGDFLLSRGEVYVADRKGKLLPGVYTVLSADGNDRNFKLRVGGLVKNFSHGEKIVVGEGDEISAVSANVLLR